MEEFFTVTPLEAVFSLREEFPACPAETVPLLSAAGRILAEDIVPAAHYPEFNRAAMDGYAVKAASTFGASESSPAYLVLAGRISMGEVPQTAVQAGEAMAISTGGMLPEGADSVVMREHVTPIDETTLEVIRSVAPWTHVIAAGEDMAAGRTLLAAGSRLRAQECGALAALGYTAVPVFRKPAVGIVSTGDEIIPVDQHPAVGEIRDINTYTLAAMIAGCGGAARAYGIVGDDAQKLKNVCSRALGEVDMLLISGGSSVGTRDMTIQALDALPDSEILVHGIALSPGKPTILAKCGGLPVWGLPGQVTSAMIVFDRVLQPFLQKIAGQKSAPGETDIRIPARLTRNLASTPGRTEFIRTRVTPAPDGLEAEPIPGKSGLLNTMLKADGLIEIDMNSEGLPKGSRVDVILFP
jgi:molybdopterin molybdotransferase